MFVHYDPENKRRSRGPDFFLVLNVVDRERKSWVAWQEGMRFPDVIIELLSDTTRAVDKGEKKTLYEGLFRTAEYYLYDPWSQEFIGYHLHGMHYHEVELDAEQKLYSAATGLYLGIREGWLRWLTIEGAVVPTPLELAGQEKLRAEQAEQQAEQKTPVNSEPSRLSSSWPCIGVASVTWENAANRSNSVLGGCSLVLAVRLHEV